MDNFRTIYRILKYLEGAMDCAEPDYEPIGAVALGLSKERWSAIMRMLAMEGYVEGVTLKSHIRSPDTVTQFEPRITLKGLEYLNENSMMKKAMQIAKGIKEVIPGI